MALTSTIFRFELSISDMDRGVYADALELRVARHPSETDVYMVTRLLAYALSYEEGIEFSKGGLSDTAEPAVYIDDLTGRRLLWVEVGQPAAAKLHKATKAADAVAVFSHREPENWLANMERETIHQREAVRVVSFDESFLSELVAGLTRNNSWSLVLTDGVLYLDTGSSSVSGNLHEHAL